MSEHNLTLTICRLVAYLVANVVKDEKEYREWGLPFIAISVEAQFGKDVGAQVISELDSKFCPLIGHGLSLILEEPELEDFTLVHSAEVLLSSILNEIESTDDNFESSLRLYMDTFFQFVLSSRSDEVYDARTRVIARRMCDALNLSAAEFSDLESTHWQAESSPSEPLSAQDIADSDYLLEGSSKSQARRKFYQKFNLDSRHVPRSSILASFRIWRVAFIAAGGGALMALTGAIAAPAIMSTVLPLICTSTSLGQVSVALNTALSCVGLTSLEIIPTLMSSYGAAVAGQKMLHRTAPLQDFALKPLHVEDGDVFEPLDASEVFASAYTCNGNVVDDTIKQDDKSGNTSDSYDIVSGNTSANASPSDAAPPPTSSASAAFARTWDKPSTTTPTSTNRIKHTNHAIGTENTPGTGAKDSHAPVFILVSGHLERGIDARQMWGANGFIQNIVDTATTTLSGTITGLVQGSGKSEAVVKEVVTEVTGATTMHSQNVTTTVTTASTNGATDITHVETTATSHTTYTTDTASTPQTPHSPLPTATAARTDQPHTTDEPLTDWETVDPSFPGWWRGHIARGEEYVLQWEPAVLEKLHDSLQRIVLDKVFGKLKGMMKGEILKFTPIPGLRAAASLPLMVMRKINELDDPWVIATDRAQQAGKLLARVLLAEHRRNKDSATAGTSSSTTARITGRPITLVGYGMGARLIFHCLETLAAEGGVDARGIVENAVLIGAPIGMDLTKWAAVRAVVAGRLVNCYAWNDWILALLYRSKSYEIGVAGLYPIVLSGSASGNGGIGGSGSGGSVSNVKSSVSSAVVSGGNQSDRSVEVTTTTSTTTSTSTAVRKPRLLHKHSSAFEVENFDVSHLITSHTDYPRVLPEIIAMLDL